MTDVQNIDYSLLEYYGWLGPYAVGVTPGSKPQTADEFIALLKPPAFQHASWPANGQLPQLPALLQRNNPPPPPIMPTWEDLGFWPDFSLLEASTLLDPTRWNFKPSRSYNSESKRQLKADFPFLYVSSLSNVYDSYHSYAMAWHAIQSSLLAIFWRFDINSIAELDDLRAGVKAGSGPLYYASYGGIPVMQPDRSLQLKLFEFGILPRNKRREVVDTAITDSTLQLHREWLKFQGRRLLLEAMYNLPQPSGDEHIRMRPQMPLSGKPSLVWPDVFCFAKAASDTAGKFQVDQNKAICIMCLQAGTYLAIKRRKSCIQNMHRHLQTAHGIAIPKL